MQVTLPAAYCKIHGITPGTPLDFYLVEDSNYLIIGPKPKATAASKGKR